MLKIDRLIVASGMLLALLAGCPPGAGFADVKQVKLGVKGAT